MTDDRTTWNIATETAEKLESVAGRKEHESANDFLLRVVEMVAETEDGTDVIESNIPEDVLTVDHIPDIADASARRTTKEIEEQFP